MDQSLEYEKALSPVLVKIRLLLQNYFNMYFSRANFPLPIIEEEGFYSICGFTTRGMDTF